MKHDKEIEILQQSVWKVSQEISELPKQAKKLKIAVLKDTLNQTEEGQAILQYFTKINNQLQLTEK